MSPEDAEMVMDRLTETLKPLEIVGEGIRDNIVFTKATPILDALWEINNAISIARHIIRPHIQDDV